MAKKIITVNDDQKWPMSMVANFKKSLQIFHGSLKIWNDVATEEGR